MSSLLAKFSSALPRRTGRAAPSVWSPADDILLPYLAQTVLVEPRVQETGSGLWKTDSLPSRSAMTGCLGSNWSRNVLDCVLIKICAA